MPPLIWRSLSNLSGGEWRGEPKCWHVSHAFQHKRGQQVMFVCGQIWLVQSSPPVQSSDCWRAPTQTGRATGNSHWFIQCTNCVTASAHWTPRALNPSKIYKLLHRRSLFNLSGGEWRGELKCWPVSHAFLHKRGEIILFKVRRSDIHLKPTTAMSTSGPLTKKLCSSSPVQSPRFCIYLLDQQQSNNY